MGLGDRESRHGIPAATDSDETLDGSSTPESNPDQPLTFLGKQLDESSAWTGVEERHRVFRQTPTVNLRHTYSNVRNFDEAF